MKLIRISVLFLIIFIPLVCVLETVMNYSHLCAEIESNKLIYSKELGWISKSHANPEGVKSFLDRYECQQIERGDTIIYAQFWGKKLLGKYHYVKVEKQYLVLKNIPEAEKEKALFYVFKDVSEKFEATQAYYPLYFSLPFNSSFANGDLTGNLLSFYCAINELELSELINDLNLESAFEKKLSDYTENYSNLNWINSNSDNEFNQFFREYSEFENEDYLGSCSEGLSLQQTKEY